MLTALFIIFLTINIKYFDMCTTNSAYFPENGAMAIAVLKGALNGSAIQGTVTFSQAVKNFPSESILCFLL